MPTRRAANKTKRAKDARLAESARTVLGDIVASLEKAPARSLFPNGVRVIDVSISVGETRIDIKVIGNATATAPAATSALPECCRDVFRMAPLLPPPADDDLTVGQKVPNTSESAASGAIVKKIKRTDPEFEDLVENNNAKIVFKDEEGTGADRMMSSDLKGNLDALADMVIAQWTGVKLRVTEAWDENNEHAGASLHYEGRAADLTTHPIDQAKLGRLGRLAVDAGFDWVWFENAAHIHVSIRA